MSFFLNTLRKNRFNQICYAVGPHPHNKPVSSDVWTVENPSQEVLDVYHKDGTEVRTYGEKTFLMSAKAASCIQPEGLSSGSAVALYFIHKGVKYYVMTIDNKPYMQHPQGMANEGESAVECAVREVKEELNIALSPHKLAECGGWSFSNYNELVDYERISTTTLFAARITFDDVKHLVGSRDLDENYHINITDVKDLDETQHVCFVSEYMFSRAEESYELRGGRKVAFNGHHRVIGSMLSSHSYATPYAGNTSYLKTFSCEKPKPTAVAQRFLEAFKELVASGEPFPAEYNPSYLIRYEHDREGRNVTVSSFPTEDMAYEMEGEDRDWEGKYGSDVKYIVTAADTEAKIQD